MDRAELGIIGGSGLYDFEGLDDQRAIEMSTPFGAPSGPITMGRYGERRIAFLSRHGQGHRLSPTAIPVRANIWALKSLGVTRIVSISAMGSLQANLAPRDFIVPDQLIDRTFSRAGTFFDEGVVAHIAFGDPFCPDLSAGAADSLASAGVRVLRGGSCVVIEGPAFSTRAESQIYRSWGASAIGMTALPEAKLAREAEICYAIMGAITDYDTWHATEADVNVETVVGNLTHTVASARRALVTLFSAALPKQRHCPCASALEGAIITDPAMIAEEQKHALRWWLDDTGQRDFWKIRLGSRAVPAQNARGGADRVVKRKGEVDGKTSAGGTLHPRLG